MLYFAYGSNLDPLQMQRRCPDSYPVRAAKLEGWSIGFAGYSQGWGGAVATVERDAGSVVEGVLFNISKRDLRKLDACEGWPWVYERRSMRVRDEHGVWRSAIVYVHRRRRIPSQGPSRIYFARVAAAYKNNGFNLAPLERAATAAA